MSQFLSHSVFASQADLCRCGLHDNMLYFGYLIPLCLLMVANMVVFCLVYKAIGRHHKHIKSGRLVAYKFLRKPVAEPQGKASPFQDKQNSFGQF